MSDNQRFLELLRGAAADMEADPDFNYYFRDIVAPPFNFEQYFEFEAAFARDRLHRKIGQWTRYAKRDIAKLAAFGLMSASAKTGLIRIKVRQ